MASGQPLRTIVDAIVSRDLSPEAQGRAVAAFAREKLAEAQAVNRQVTGREPTYQQFVDGSRGAPLERVRTDGGVILFLFDTGANAVLAWIAEQLFVHSPVLTGEFRASHKLFAGGREIEPAADLPAADEYVFLSPLPFAGRLERHYAPEGVFEGVAALARRQFRDQADIRFQYRSLSEFGLGSGGAARSRAEARRERTPAIVVRMR